MLLVQLVDQNLHFGRLKKEVRPINVTREVYRMYFVRKSIPAIRSKRPSSGSGTVLVQLDHAKPHIPTNDSVVAHEDILNESYESRKGVRLFSAR